LQQQIPDVQRFPVSASTTVVMPRPLQAQERQMYHQILGMMNNAHASGFQHAMYTDAYQHGKKTVQDLLMRSLHDPKALETIENDCYLHKLRGSFEVLQQEKDGIPGLFTKTAWQDLPSRIIVDQGKLYPFALREFDDELGHRYTPGGEWSKRIPIPEALMPKNYLNMLIPPENTDQYGIYFLVERPLEGALQLRTST